MSIDRHGRAAACSGVPHEDLAASGAPAPEAAPEVLEFIRYCYRRRGFGWPELYDEMCGVAARGLFRGMDYERLAALGVGFSLGELPRLAQLAQRVVAEERAERIDAVRGPKVTVSAVTDGGAMGGTAAGGLVPLAQPG